MVAVTQLAELILGVPGLEGVTFSGGEPLAQVGPLLELAQRLVIRGLSIVCYTGFTLAELRAREDIRVTEFLQLCDVLIDGRYDERVAGFHPWRGSSNQQVHFLTARYQDYRERLESQGSTREVEMIVTQDGYTATGILDLELLQSVDTAVKNGLSL